MKKLDAIGFAKLFATTPDDIYSKCGELVQKYDFTYDILEQDELKETILLVLKTLESNKLSISGEDRREEWEKGWSENLNAFVENNYDVTTLVPRYMHKINIKRLFSDYIRPADENFELNIYTVYRHYLFQTYLSGYDCIYEFGCGTGYNLLIMAQLFPDKKLFGLDWADSSVKLVYLIGDSFKANIQGRIFNYFDPDYTLYIEDNSALITLNSLEQIGSNFGKYLEFLLAKKPCICINSEPFIELYQKDDLLDYLAIKYHKKRNYLNGYLSALRQLEMEGKIKIEKVQRVHFGNIFHEAQSFVVWRIL